MIEESQARGGVDPMIGGRISVRVSQQASGYFVASIMDGWWMAIGETRESAIKSAIKRYQDDPLDCGYACGFTEPYGFVPEAGCPIHDNEWAYTCPRCGSELEEQEQGRLTKKLVDIILKCPKCPYQINLTRPEPIKPE